MLILRHNIVNNFIQESTKPSNSQEPEQSTDAEVSKDVKEGNDAAAKTSVEEDTSSAAKPSPNSTNTPSNEGDKTLNANSSDQSKTDLLNGDKPGASNPATQSTKEEPAAGGSIAKDEKNNSQENGDINTVEGKCQLKELRSRGVYKGDHASFWPEGWRSKLCTCDSCKVRYHII